MGGHIVGQIGGEVAELREVARAVGQVHVAEHEDLVGILVPVQLFECEIHPFNSSGAAFQIVVEQGKNSGRGNLVAARNRNENVSPFLFRFELIDASFVGCGHVLAVGHDNTGHAAFVRSDDAVNRGIFVGSEVGQLVDDVDIKFSE